MSGVVIVTRRDFVKVSSAASLGLILAAELPSVVGAESIATAAASLGPFVQVSPDGQITIWVHKSEMGQGVRTTLPMIVAEELDAEWSRVRIRQSDLDSRFGSQGTGGSSSVRTTWMPLRKTGATARAMLVAAAAAGWSVEPATCQTDAGMITHVPTGRSVSYGEVAKVAATLPVPADVSVKAPASFRIIGRQKVERLDNIDIVCGRARFGIDSHPAGMLYAVVLRSPVFGGTVVSVDDKKARSMPGVRTIVRIEARGSDLPWNGVAVVATSTWAAMKGRDALKVQWDEGTRATESSASLSDLMAEIVSKPGRAIRHEGNADDVLAAAAQRIEATYEVPYLAHATMEPMNCTAHATPSSLELWAPTQFADWAASTCGHALGLSPEQVKVHVTLLGGGFGRRANPDFALEASLISRAAGAPVKVQWTREDDMQHDFYRPASMHKLTAALGKDGKPVAWRHRLVSPSIDAYMHGTDAKNIQESEMEGAADIRQRIPNLRVDYAYADSGVPRGWWRSVANSGNTFVVQSFFDELAHAAGKDPVAYQLALLGDAPVASGQGEARDYPFNSGRMRRVIELAAEKGGWSQERAAGRFLGFAAEYSFLTYVAEIAEVSVADDGTPRVHRIVAAVDCGTPVNPDGVAAQIEGGINFGLTAALKGRISLNNGRVEQSNFHDYELLRMNEAPKIEVHIVPSDELPTGTGEPGLPPLAPAVCNAIFAATGKRVRRLPIDPADIRKG